MKSWARFPAAPLTLPLPLVSWGGLPIPLKLKKAQWVKDCWDHHSQYISETDVAVDWGDWDSEHDRCWCCGHSGKLQKCHIIPKSLGGLDNASNLVPLCAVCHDQSPDVADKDAMFQWIALNQNSLSGVGLGRYYHVTNVVTQRLGEMRCEPDLDKFKQNINDAYLLASFHFSQSNAGIKMKESTREWVINKAFDLYQEQSA